MSQNITVTHAHTQSANLPDFTEENTPKLWWRGTAEATQAAVADAYASGHITFAQLRRWAENATSHYVEVETAETETVNFENVADEIQADGPTAPLTGENPEISYAEGVALAAAAMPAV